MREKQKISENLETDLKKTLSILAWKGLEYSIKEVNRSGKDHDEYYNDARHLIDHKLEPLKFIKYVKLGADAEINENTKNLLKRKRLKNFVHRRIENILNTSEK